MGLGHWVTYINVGLETRVRKALWMTGVLLRCRYTAAYEHQILLFSSPSLSTEHRYSSSV